MTIRITKEMIDPTPANLLDKVRHMQLKGLDQEEWCRIYTGRSWFNDVAPEWAAHAALMCDASEIDFNEPLLSPLGSCDKHPYDISSACALQGWEHAEQVTPEVLAQWWEEQHG